MNGSCSEPRHNPANVRLGCPLISDSSDDEVTEEDENLLSIVLDSDRVVNVLEIHPCLSLAESKGLATSFKPLGCHHKF